MPQRQIQCPECGACNTISPTGCDGRLCDRCRHEFVSEDTFVPQRIFISYGHDEHASLALRLRDDLEDRGHLAWLDEGRLLPGYDREQDIDEGLHWVADARPDAAVLLLMRPYSVRRPDGYCLNEIARAVSLGLRIIPVMGADCEPPLSICRIQWLDMRDCVPVAEKEERYEAKFDRLIQALEGDRLDFEGAQSRLLDTLQPIRFSADILDLLEDFTGREWVFEEVDAWLRGESDEKVLWISGDPGVGKSTIGLCTSLARIQHVVGDRRIVMITYPIRTYG